MSESTLGSLASLEFKHEWGESPYRCPGCGCGMKMPIVDGEKCIRRAVCESCQGVWQIFKAAPEVDFETGATVYRW